MEEARMGLDGVKPVKSGPGVPVSSLLPLPTVRSLGFTVFIGEISADIVQEYSHNFTGISVLRF